MVEPIQSGQTRFFLERWTADPSKYYGGAHGDIPNKGHRIAASVAKPDDVYLLLAGAAKALLKDYPDEAGKD